MSPSGLQRLLAVVLSGPSMSDPMAASRSADPLLGTPDVNAVESHANTRIIRDPIRDADIISVHVQSAGFHDGNFARIMVNDVDYSPNARGLNVLVIDYTGNIVEVASFDTHISPTAAEAFVKFVEQLDLGTVIVIAVRDECTEQLSTAIETLTALGSQLITEVGYRDSWCMITVKGKYHQSAYKHRMIN
jgi:hypothetical protein